MNPTKIVAISSPEASPASEVIRTFSPFRETESDETDWESWFREAHGNKTTWSDILKERLVVVLGEAGIGKTYEFREQARRLRSQAKAAFFIQLNLLDRQKDWVSALAKQATLFEKWKGSADPGIFFLDAVDEARLTGPVALHRALSCVTRALTGNLDRVSFIISSRISDWSLPTVRDLVQQQLALPKTPPSSPAPPVNGETTTTTPAASDAVPLIAHKLDPLSVESAKRLAVFYGVTAVDAFWQEVEDGNYRFLATRPLDLEWMAIRWRRAGRLGSFAEIVEDAVTNRLVEKNPGYIEAGAVLSMDQLRQGAEALAAASTLSGTAYLQVEPGAAALGAFAPSEVLPAWKPREHQRLLGSAVFDEATYGRVQFHHRAVREYLTAWWVKRQLDAGLPFSQAWELFARAPYGEEVLIPSRRPVLCWLAALDAKVRGRVIRTFPEMIIYEGDPQQWSVDDVVEAFEGYLNLLTSGFRPDWWNDPAEYRRVARMIPAEALSRWIESYSDNYDVLPRLLTIVEHGRGTSCADQVFALYRHAGFTNPIVRYLLDTLAVIATVEQRASIVEDLLSGRLQGNEFISDGIKAVGLVRFPQDQLITCFQRAEPESRFGGPMATAVKVYLLPSADLADATKLLAALVTALPALNARELAHGVDEGERKEGWILSVLPDALLKVLQLASSLDPASEVLVIDAAITAEKLQHTSYANDEDFRNLRVAFARFPELRKAVALRIAHSSDILHAASTLTWGTGVVHLGHEDLDWLVPSANDSKCNTADRGVWYTAARDIAFMQLRGNHRRVVLNALVAGPDAEGRRKDIDAIISKRIEGLREQQKWKHDDIARKNAAREVDAQNKTALLKQIEAIHAGAAFGAIQWLVVRAVERAARSRYTKVNVDVVYREFGPEIGGAFDEGLARAWRTFDAPDSTNYLDNSVPWAGLVGIASANHAFETGLDVATLTEEEVGKLVRLCVWELDRLEAWFARLVEARLAEVTRALAPWLKFELALPGDDRIRRTIEMVLREPQPLRLALLPIAVEYIRSGKVSSERLRRKLVSEIMTAGLAGSTFVGELARAALENGLTASLPVFETAWFSDWACADLASAWAWFETSLESLRGLQEDPIGLLAQALDQSSDVWKSLTGTAEQVSALGGIWRLLDVRLHGRNERSKDDPRWSSASQLLDRIPTVLSSLRGKHAHQSLSELSREHGGTRRGNWLMGKVREQGARDAEDAARIAPAKLPVIGEPFTREPRTETELFEQVMARLAEIAEGVERGPFSERGLFPARIAEKQLQLWLAARLEDTPRRSFTARFSVAREPTVDADKRTDIEVSTKVGKVCIEIKPLDEFRSYSAQSLTEDTLNRQLVGQYLRGKNSQHGVLVVCRLDRKTWHIPGADGMRGFDELVAYLREQAQTIVENDHHISRLEVLPIDCTLRI